MTTDRRSRPVGRRGFLKSACAAAGLGAAAGRGVSIVDASAAPARWAVKELEQALAARGVPVRVLSRLEEAPSGDLRIVAGAAGAPAVPEALALLPRRDALLASGGDPRGLIYALLELADRVGFAADPLKALDIRQPVVERPANSIRSVTRCFVSEVEDKPWFHDRAMWPRYLTMLATQRFNRFSFATGIGYDFPRNIRDCYLHFPYPFLLPVAGYDVRAVGLPDEERDRNLAMLRFISDQTEARGLDFQLAIWTHAYQWIDSPNATYTISGLTPGNHAAYCRDALHALLAACPAIRGVTFRVHGESGVAEGSYSFWKTLFDGIVRSGRPIEIDMHAKGMDQTMIDLALATGMPVNISPKYWAEHMGLPYHQAAIRELEMPPRNRKDEGFMALSSGSRRFLRYGYGDLMREDRRYGVLHRVWPGTQRILLWGDPVMAAAYGRASSFCGSSGVELCEPLSFKGRKGSGLAGGRCAYADASLNPPHDWEKYLYTCRVWGRLLYNPEAEPDVWRRYLRNRFDHAAEAAESALAHASRILPLVTTAHGASGANNSYWPEMYTNMPIVDAARKHPYSDTPAPKRFGAVSPFDPQMFARVDDFAEELLKGERGGKYSPLEVAQWLDELAGAAARNLAQAEARAGDRPSPEFRRLAIDVAIQSGLGRFFAWKLRSAVLYALWERGRDRSALAEAVKAYRAARAAWAELAGRARGVYRDDVTVGYDRHLRGHWMDRLQAIDDDLADMVKRLEDAPAGQVTQKAVREGLAPSPRPSIRCGHTPPAHFVPGQPLALELALEGAGRISARLLYRHVNQAESHRAAQMEARGEGRYRAEIGADYTHSPFPLQYHFELRDETGAAWLYPGLQPSLSNQPYFVVRRA